LRLYLTNLTLCWLPGVPETIYLQTQLGRCYRQIPWYLTVARVWPTNPHLRHQDTSTFTSRQRSNRNNGTRLAPQSPTLTIRSLRSQPTTTLPPLSFLCFLLPFTALPLALNRSPGNRLVHYCGTSVRSSANVRASRVSPSC